MREDECSDGIWAHVSPRIIPGACRSFLQATPGKRTAHGCHFRSVIDNSVHSGPLRALGAEIEGVPPRGSWDVHRNAIDRPRGG
jgi:hypothetical protein